MILFKYRDDVAHFRAFIVLHSVDHIKSDIHRPSCVKNELKRDIQTLLTCETARLANQCV